MNLFNTLQSPMILRFMLLLVLPLLASGCKKPTDSHDQGPVPSSIVPKGPPLQSFDLTDQENQPFNSKSLKGEPWVASFFFTNCPAMCWRLNQEIAKWQKENPESKVKFVSITCDPEVDTPAALKKYAEHFKADPKRWIFLTGALPYIERLAFDFFKLSVQGKTHSDRTVVVDRAGVIRGYFQITNPDDYKKLSKVLKEVEAENPPVEKAADESKPEVKAEPADSEQPASETPEAAKGDL